MHKVSTACGAAIGALESAWKHCPSAPAPERNGQFLEIFKHVQGKLEDFQDVHGTRGAGDANPTITDAGHAKLAQIINEKIKEDLLAIIKAVEISERHKDEWKAKKTIIIGGIQINLEPIEAEGSSPAQPKHWKKKSKDNNEQDYFLVTDIIGRNMPAGSPLEGLTKESLVL